MLIDSHLHVPCGSGGVDSLLRYMDANGVDKAWLMTWEESAAGPWPYSPIPVENVIAAYRKYPERFVPMYAPDPGSPDALEKFKYWYEKGVMGFAELKVTLAWDDERVLSMLSFLQDKGIPVVFHMEKSEVRFYEPGKTGWFRKNLIKSARNDLVAGFPANVMKKVLEYIPAAYNSLTYRFPGYMLDFLSLEKALAMFPELNFIGHGPYFWENISGQNVSFDGMHPRGKIGREGVLPGMLRKYPNLFADTSGVSGINAFKRDEGYARGFLKEFKDQVVFGTDNFELGQKEFFDSLVMAPEVYESIYCGTASKLVLYKTV